MIVNVLCLKIMRDTGYFLRNLKRCDARAREMHLSNEVTGVRGSMQKHTHTHTHTRGCKTPNRTVSARNTLTYQPVFTVSTNFWLKLKKEFWSRGRSKKPNARVNGFL